MCIAHVNNAPFRPNFVTIMILFDSVNIFYHLGTAPLFAKSLSKIFTPEGKSCQLSVKITGTPEPEVQWYRNGQPVRKDSRHSITKDGDTNTLSIRNVGINDEGLYSVKAVNSVGYATCQGELYIESMCFSSSRLSFKSLE